ncbi:hypothetical protein HELRODRAFT_167008 [Helobdella robusta]|uniref:Endonuclease/exonuclease/phosphatase domain-containing protein n=1 Tax=Helobdella robusta TaxID=6412 RepID=T1EYW2_HELRO|nr:hypothetical protein HELRODRAFT_167008 [Helobdella robusta]ESO11915.1 hypothetical protein HELRODRAFT_167008 [Helobdella robusta]
MSLIETLHGSSNEFAVRCAIFPGFNIVDYAKSHDPYHGGIIIYLKKEFIYETVELLVVITFKAVAIKLTINNSDFILLSIYRPGSVLPSPSFSLELMNVLEVSSLLSDKIVAAGDFNVHMERRDDPNTASLNDVFNFVNIIAPKHVIESRDDLLTPWFERGCSKSKAYSRKMERKYRKTITAMIGRCGKIRP